MLKERSKHRKKLDVNVINLILTDSCCEVSSTSDEACTEGRLFCSSEGVEYMLRSSAIKGGSSVNITCKTN